MPTLFVCFSNILCWKQYEEIVTSGDLPLMINILLSGSEKVKMLA